MKKNILYSKSEWIDNIGNSIIDVGAYHSIMGAIGSTTERFSLFQISQYPYFIFSGVYPPKVYCLPNKMFSMLGHLMGDFSESIIANYSKIRTLQTHTNKKNERLFELATFVDADYVIFAGAVLTARFFSIYSDFLAKLKKNQSKIIFYGCSGDLYSNPEISFVKTKLKELSPYAIITRDTLAYQYYHNLAEYSYNGIDCGFFANISQIREIKLNLPPYVVLNFDSAIYNRKISRLKAQLTQDLTKNYVIINAYHTIDNKMASLVSSGKEKNLFLSDNPFDYLLLYANCKTVYTNRVHACVPTLSFGNACRLFSNSPRVDLFERMGLSNITSMTVHLDAHRLEIEKENQIKFLSSILN